MDEDRTKRAEDIMGRAVAQASDLVQTNPFLAEMVLKQLLRCDPEHPDGLHLLGLAKHRMGKHVEGIEIIQAAIDVNPSNPDNHNNIALCYACVENFDRAIFHLNKAIEMKPDNYLYYNNLALQYRNIGKHHDAIATLEKALGITETTEMWTNLGGVYGELRDLVKAQECFDKALAMNPDCSAAHVDKAFAYHLAGDWEKGFEEYEWRFTYFEQLQYYKQEYDQTKKWDGKESLEGKTILVYSEQGIGDCIQNYRYLPILKERGAKVILHCPESLKPVMARMPAVDQVLIRDIVFKTGEDFPEYDYQVSSFSLPHLLHEYAISGQPYIKPVTRKFIDIVNAEYADKLKVGIVWAGSPSHPKDRTRSIPLRHFTKIRDIEGVQLLNMQIDLRLRVHQNEQHTINFAEGCEDWNLVSLTHMIQSWEDTCTLLVGLDLVVCCDTAIAHMAGAMGIPCWILLEYNNDWRWKYEGNRTEWYDSVRLFRQKERGNWSGVLDEVKEAIDEHLLSH